MRVELVTENQHESLVDLLCELRAFYNEDSVVRRELVEEHCRENLLAIQSPHRLIVASGSSGAVVGLAAITLAYSLVDFTAEKRKHCQLKELYVRSSQRSKGVGRALMSGVARYAFENGCRRIDWPVKASNARGISFYEGLGARLVAERLGYRLSDPNIGELAYERTNEPLGG